MKKTLSMLCSMGLIVFPWIMTEKKSESPLPSIILLDSIESDRTMHRTNVLAAIKGKEKMPADSVFKNIKVLKGMPAERVLAIMDFGWSRGLGVSCGHCHNTNDWASEEKKQMQIARDMSQMSAHINTTMLPAITGFKEKKSAPFVNCTTCHQGKAAFNTPQK